MSQGLPEQTDYSTIQFLLNCLRTLVQAATVWMRLSAHAYQIGLNCLTWSRRLLWNAALRKSVFLGLHVQVAGCDACDSRLECRRSHELRIPVDVGTRFHSMWAPDSV